MEKINIAELLRNCPKGMVLNCTIFENVTFERVADNGIWVKHVDSKSCKHDLYLYCDGSFPIHNLGSLSTKCVIFPEGKTTWDGFVPPCKFKDVDVFSIKSDTYYLCVRNLFDEFGNIIFHKDDTYYSSEDGYLIPSNSNIPYKVEYCADEYFHTHETKTLEKLVKPKFKSGDNVLCCLQ